MGGWGPMFGTKSQKKRFFWTPSLMIFMQKNQMGFFPVAGLFGGFVPFLLASSLPVPHLPGYNKVTLKFLVKKALEIHTEPS